LTKKINRYRLKIEKYIRKANAHKEAYTIFNSSTIGNEESIKNGIVYEFIKEIQ